MTTSVFHRRRAERFAELLDDAASHRRADPELSTMVALVHRAVTLELDASPSPQFRTDLRAMLLATAEREGIGATEPDAPRRWHRPAPGRLRTSIVVGVAAGAVALSGMSVASGDAKPGDPLYRVKRSTERAQLAFAGSDVTRGQLYLEFARTRLAEAKAVTGDAGSFPGVLGDMDSDTRQGVKLLTTAALDRHDPAALDAVDTFVADQQGGITSVLDKVNGGSRTRLLGSLGLLSQVATRSQQLRETLTCGGAASDGSDALGPRPRSCSPASNSATGSTPTQQEPARNGGHGTRNGSTEASATPAPAAPGSTPTGANATSSAGVAGETGGPTSSQPPSPTASSDGGLLGGLNRIVGGLLG